MTILYEVVGRVATLIIQIIATLGYGGVGLLMAFESAGVALPSEIIMPFAGYLVLSGRFTLFGAALAGALGCLAGSLGAYWISAVLGRAWLERYGRYILFSRRDLALADRVFARWGDAIVFIGRLMPVVRTYISFPAGVARMNLPRFSWYTFVGSLIWTYLLAWIGLRLGAQWPSIRAAFERFDWVIGLLLLAGLFWWAAWHWRARHSMSH